MHRKAEGTRDSSGVHQHIHGSGQGGRASKGHEKEPHVSGRSKDASVNLAGSVSGIIISSRINCVACY